MIESYMQVNEAAEKWNLTQRMVQKVCSEGRIEGAVKFGRSWAIPRNTERPKDLRVKSGKYRDWRKK